jgi:hypothetical protein
MTARDFILVEQAYARNLAAHYRALPMRLAPPVLTDSVLTLVGTLPGIFGFPGWDAHLLFHSGDKTEMERPPTFS